MERVGRAVGLDLKVVITKGDQPVGYGIGPALEAEDVLSVLQNDKDGPEDLRERALLLAGKLLELSGTVGRAMGYERAKKLLTSGKAYEKFTAICRAQGRFSLPVRAPFLHEIRASHAGNLTRIDNRKIAKLAKLSGAPHSKSAGIRMNVKLGDQIVKDQLLYTVFAESKGELNYALDYQHNHPEIVTIKSS